MRDVYFKKEIHRMLEDDEMSGEEAGFMLGYLS